MTWKGRRSRVYRFSTWLFGLLGCKAIEGMGRGEWVMGCHVIWDFMVVGL